MFQQVLFEVVDGVGRATLNRPDLLNALNLDMIKALNEKLGEWAGDRSIRAVMILGAGGKAFCAGGDVRAIAEARARSDFASIREFFRQEYRLDYRIANYPKKLIAVMDGVTMGGGAGLAINAPIRVVTERASFAMPECAIGFVPDVGAGHFLNKCPGEIGIFLALTGQRLLTAGMSYCGLATHAIEAKSLAELTPETLDRLSLRTRTADIERIQPGIDLCFGLGSLAETLTILRTRKDAGSKDSVRLMSWGSPFALMMTYEHMRRSRGKSLADVLKEEFRLSVRLVERPDFAEGVRALLLDRDKNPTWSPRRIEDVSAEDIAEMFSSLPDGEELVLDID